MMLQQFYIMFGLLIKFYSKWHNSRIKRPIVHKDFILLLFIFQNINMMKTVLQPKCTLTSKIRRG